MVETKIIGIKIPLDLYLLVLTANPDKDFNTIVIEVLSKKYGFSTHAPIVKDKKIIDSKINKFLFGSKE